MKANLDSSYYSKKKGCKMFRYVLSGTSDEIETYKVIAGEGYRENENGQSLWFTRNYVGDNLLMGFNQDQTGMFVNTVKQDKLLSLVGQQVDKDVRRAMADKVADVLLQESGALSHIAERSTVVKPKDFSKVNPEDFSKVNSEDFSEVEPEDFSEVKSEDFPE